MIQAFPVVIKRNSSLRMAVAFYLAYAGMLLLSLNKYVAWQSLCLILGVIALPLVTTVQPGNYGSKRYGLLTVLLAVCTILVPVKTLLFLTIALACIFVTEQFIGKLNWLPVCVVILMSPFFQFVANVFSFPIRLQLTHMAGAIMNKMLGHVVVQGNMILYNGNEYLVDPACMGLNMLVTSLLLQLMVIAVYQRKFKRSLAVWQVTGLLAIAFSLNVISNLFRIVCLVWFNFLPETLMHEAIGICCLLIYVMLPIVAITKWVVNKKGKPVIMPAMTPAARQRKYALVLHSLLFLTICYAAYAVMDRDTAMMNNAGQVAAVDGYTSERVNTEIVKLQNKEALVYIKYIPAFYQADHHPMICWRGSGFLFQQVQLETIAGQKVYTAILKNDKELLYTAWWYDNGVQRTIDQLSWRSDMLAGGKAYSLVNVTAETKPQLIKQLEEVIHKNSIKPLL